jgi:hypothetical protein
MSYEGRVDLVDAHKNKLAGNASSAGHFGKVQQQFLLSDQAYTSKAFWHSL